MKGRETMGSNRNEIEERRQGVEKVADAARNTLHTIQDVVAALVGNGGDESIGVDACGEGGVRGEEFENGYVIKRPSIEMYV